MCAFLGKRALIAANSVSAKPQPATRVDSRAFFSRPRSMSQRGLRESAEQQTKRIAGTIRAEHPTPAGLREPGLNLRLRRIALRVGDGVIDERLAAMAPQSQSDSPRPSARGCERA